MTQRDRSPLLRRLNRHCAQALEDAALVDELVRACLLPDSGARNIDNLLDQQILPILSRELLARICGSRTPAQIRLSCSNGHAIMVEFDEVAGATP